MVSDSRWTGGTGAVVRERSEVTAHSKHTRIHTHFLFLVQLTSVTIGNGDSQDSKTSILASDANTADKDNIASEPSASDDSSMALDAYSADNSNVASEAKATDNRSSGC